MAAEKGERSRHQLSSLSESIEPPAELWGMRSGGRSIESEEIG